MRKSALGDGLELRAGELMSIVPPSINPESGEPYEWRTALDEAPILPLPDAWLKAAQVPGRRTDAPTRSADDGSGCSPVTFPKASATTRC